MKFNNKQISLLISVLSVLIFLISWEVISNYSSLSLALFSKPTFIINKLILLFIKQKLIFHLGISLKILFSAIFLSFISGLILSSVSYYYNTFYNIIRPFIYFFNSIPIITIVPLFIVWLGFGDISKIIALSLILCPIFFIKIYDGFSNMSKDHILLGKSLNLSPVKFFKLIILFSLYPNILTSFRLSIGRAVIGIIIVDIYGYGRGLGYLFNVFTVGSDIPGIMVIIFILSSINFFLISILYFVNYRLNKKYFLGGKQKFF